MQFHNGWSDTEEEVELRDWEKRIGVVGMDKVGV